MTQNRASPIAVAIQVSKAWGLHFPVDVRRIALELTSRQRDPIAKIEGFDFKGAEGFLAKNGTSNRWGVGYSTHIREEGKINFTIAHEFGHYLCHRAEGGNMILCSHDDMVNFPSKGQARNIEQEANAFASYLLMPIPDFRQQIDGQRITIDLLTGCAARYDTTLAATALKLAEFTDQAVVVMSSAAGKVRWARSSDTAMRMGLLFRKGTPVPPNSVTALCATGGTGGNSQLGLVVPAPTWSGIADVLESVVAQPHYGCVFTVLHMTHTGDSGRALEEEPAEDAYDRFTSLR